MKLSFLLLLSVGFLSCTTTTKNNQIIEQCDYVTARCEIEVKPGNYHLELCFDQPYTGRIFAESRRLVFDSAISNTDGKCIKLSVNVRDPEGQPIQETAQRGSAGLTLIFDRSIEVLTQIKVKPAPELPVIYIAGDSTVCDQDPQWDKPADERYSGWGQLIPAYFNNGIIVTNYADSGEGTLAFNPPNGELWKLIAGGIKAGDWVLIQLGHNDKTTSAEVFRTRLRELLIAVKTKQAYPVLISPMVRNNGEPLTRQHIWPGLNIRKELIALAENEQVPLIDLMQLSDNWVNQLGQDSAQSYFVNDDRTHTNEKGAALFAAMLVSEIKKPELRGYLRE